MCSLNDLIHGRLYIIRQLWKLSEPGRLPRILVRIQREDYAWDTWLHLPRRYGGLFTDVDIRMINCGWVNNALIYWGRCEAGEHNVDFRWDRSDWAGGVDIPWNLPRIGRQDSTWSSRLMKDHLCVCIC
jgi:hypothetical protein